MNKTTVCLVTGATGTIGQHLLASLVDKGYKVLALGEIADSMSFTVLKNKKIRVTTALPISSKQFNKYDVQFCFGDISDISFLASIFNAANMGDIEIECVFHLSANRLIQKHSIASYHPDLIDMANMLEVTQAYWQAHHNTFKCFFYAADTIKSSKQIEKLIKKIKEKDNFPAVIYRSTPLTNIGVGYTGRTSLASLYRVMTPFKSPVVPMSWKKDADDELSYIASLKRAVEKILNQINSNQIPNLEE